MPNFSFGSGNQPSAHQSQHHPQQQNAQAPTLNGATVRAMPASTPALTPDLQALLQGVTPEQFAAIAHALQSGSIPLPPAGFAPPQSNASTAASVANPRPPPQPQTYTNAPAARPSNAVIDTDQEDGEIEDGELDGGSALHARGFLRTPPKGPASSRRGSHQHTNLAPNGPRAGMTPRASSMAIPKAVVANGISPAASSGNLQTASMPNKESASKAFVLEMHKAGYTYDDLAREVNDHRMLRRLFVQLGLPYPTFSSVKAPVTSQPAPSPVNAVRKQLPVQPAKVPEKADRSAYLAKLAAVKGKKTEAAKASSTPPALAQAAQPTETNPIPVQTASPLQTQPIVSAATALPIAAPLEPARATTPNTKAPVLSHDKNVLLRKKLEALRAEQAAKQKAKSSEAIQPSSQAPQQVAQSLSTGLGVGLNEVAATVVTQNVPTAIFTQPSQHTATTYPAPPSAVASPTVKRGGFSLPGLSLPGLFPMHTPSSAPPTASPLPTTTQPSFVAQPSSAAILPESNKTGAIQPLFGHRDRVNSAERCVIEVSSGEDDDEEAMDIDGSSEDEQTHKAPAVPARMTAPILSLTNSSGSSAPDTPNSWQRKMEDAAALRQKIAEMERRRKVLPPTSASPSAASIGGVAPTSTVHLENGAPPGPNALPGSQPKAAPAPAQKSIKPERKLKGVDLLADEHDPGASALPEGASLAPEVLNDHKTIFNTNTTSDIEDDDDEDLYGEDGDTQVMRYQQGQVTHGPPFVDSQAATVSGNSLQVIQPSADLGADHHGGHSPHDEMQVDKNNDEQPHETNAMSAATPSDKFDEGQEDDDDDVDDDLDNVYNPPPAIEAANRVPKLDIPAAADENDEGSDDAMDTSEESSSDIDEDHISDSGVGDVPAGAPVALVRPSESSDVNDKECHENQVSKRSPDRDLAPELQQPANDHHVLASKLDEPRTRRRYTPYESALKRFKDYSYHPNFINEVPTGFKSLTFNHKIDPVKAVCPAELYDGQCKDSTCGWQHFRNMDLLDNELLRLIGTVKTPVRDHEQKKQWNEGLTNIISELRKNPDVGRDAGLIAQRIAEYRRTFVKDPTRIVFLD